MKKTVGLLLVSLIIFGLAIFSYFWIDSQVPFYIQMHFSASAIQCAQDFSSFGNAVYPLSVFALGFVFFYCVKKNKKIGFGFLYLMISIAVSGVICDVLKGLLGRARPELLLAHPSQYGFYFWKFQAAFWSFPSGHSTVLGSYAMGLALLLPRYQVVLILSGFLLASCRIVALDHYPSDVLVGFYLGCIVAIGLYQKFKQYF